MLRKDLPSPLAPESDEEKAEPAEGRGSHESRTRRRTEAKKEPVKVAIDFEGIDQRILALPIPGAQLRAAWTRARPACSTCSKARRRTCAWPVRPPGRTLHKFDLKTRKTEKVLDGVSGFDVSVNGEKMLYSQRRAAAPLGSSPSTAAPPKPGEGALKTDGMEVRVDPARRVEADVPRSLAHRARLLLRPRPPRPRT